VSTPRIVVVGGGRTVRDAAELRDRIGAAWHVAVLGGGFIGCDVASAAMQLDVRRLIARDHHATADQLRDESLPLKRLASPAAPVP
jgi:NADPH-dependent 2,4-dienoyl-CoA reductase/sulfur reductase-like enzyme